MNVYQREDELRRRLCVLLGACRAVMDAVEALAQRGERLDSAVSELRSVATRVTEFCGMLPLEEWDDS